MLAVWKQLLTMIVLGYLLYGVANYFIIKPNICGSEQCSEVDIYTDCFHRRAWLEYIISSIYWPLRFSRWTAAEFAEDYMGCDRAYPIYPEQLKLASQWKECYFRIFEPPEGVFLN